MKIRGESKIPNHPYSKGIRMKEVLLGIIIGVVLLMFLVFGTKLIYDSPEYDDYCDYSKIYETNDSAIQNKLSQECTSNYDTANEDYSKKMFILSLIVGVFIIVGSAVFVNINSISGGLMLGSLMFLIYGTGSYWRYMNDWLRFIVLGVALGILIYVGYWLSKKGNKNKKRVNRR
jgi:hypothetical protein